MGWMRKAAAVILCLALLVVGVGDATALANGETTLLGFAFRFDGVEYNPTTDESIWRYTVIGPNVSGPTYKDLSHWLIALCVSHEVKNASGRWERLTRPDPHHGIVGLKWDDEVSKTGSRSFYFVLKGRWSEVGMVQVGAKAGTDTAVGYLPGPSCEPKMCKVDYEMTTGKFWRFLKPGVYAAPAFYILVTGDADVRLSFSDFRDPEYLGGGNMLPTILVDYSIGDTLEEAEAFGWRSARQFNELEVVVPKSDAQGGALVTIWMRVHLSELNRSSEYLGVGRVTISTQCD